MPGPRLEQPLTVRLTHWANVPLLALMAASGLQILAAFPRIGPQGAPARWYPLQGWTPPEWMRAGEWLAGARQVHFGLGHKADKRRSANSTLPSCPHQA
jgi:hypothetical protein